MIQKIVDNDGIELLSEFVLSSLREDIRIVAAKTLSAIARKDPSTRDTILNSTLHTLIGSIMK
jgi:hypothetical protein